MILLFLATVRIVIMDGKFIKVYETKSYMENGYWLNSHTVAIVCFYIYIGGHKSNPSLIIPALKTCGAIIVSKCGHFSKTFLNHYTRRGTEVKDCSSERMDELKSFQSSILQQLLGYCEPLWVYINNLWAFLLASSHYQPQCLHHRQNLPQQFITERHEDL